MRVSSSSWALWALFSLPLATVTTGFTTTTTQYTIISSPSWALSMAWGDRDGGRDRDDRSGSGRGSGRGRVGGRGSGRGRMGGRGRGGRDGPRRTNRDFRGDFGPTGHDYHPCRNAAAPSSRLSEPDIHSKIAERLMAKMNRDFGTADRVQLELAEEGVYINDRTKEWRADGVRFIDPSEGRRAPSDRNRPYVQSPHSLASDDDVQYQKIEALVAERSKQKALKNYQNADSIRDGLLDAFGVAIDDRVREWSIGGSFGKDTNLKRAHAEALQNRDYVKSSGSLPVPDGVTHEDVQSRVDERMRAKYEGKYDQADAMRDAIFEDFNVVIHDKIKMWSVGGDFGMDDPSQAKAKARSTYTRRGGGDLSEEDVEQVTALLKKRYEAKKIRDFEVADEIRSQLYDTYNVNVDDKTQEWRVLGDNYVQIKAEKGAQELTGDDLSVVESVIIRRAKLKNDKNYGEADDMRDMLESKYSVLVDDRAKEWRVTTLVPEGPSRARSSPYDNRQVDTIEVEEELVANIQDKVVLVVDPPSHDVATDIPEKAMSRDELTSLTVPLLKEKLRESGKPVSGKKAELIDRLLDEE